MQLTITRVDKIVWQGEADAVSLPGAAGEMTVLSHHMPLIATMKPGTIVVKYGDQKEKFSVQGGVIDIGKEEVAILV